MAKGFKTGGRTPGTTNKTTADARRAIASFVDDNAHRLTEWLDQVADGDVTNDIKPNPAKAFELFQSVIEYHIPKLARQELTGLDGNAIKFEINQPWLQQQIQTRNS
ncbi:MAG: hypothetical protein KGI54_08875 [Pseudomonadota bacterium]|nr:hypothetical protein [Pseudomonadota bacterium]